MAKVLEVLELGDLAVELVPVRLNRHDDATSATTTVTLMAYKSGPRCPVSKKVELAQIRQRYVELSEEEFKTTTGNIAVPLVAAYCREVFLSMIQGLQFEEAELLASDDDKLLKTMVYLGIWQESEETSTDDDQGEVKAALQITLRLSPTLTVAMGRVIGQI